MNKTFLICLIFLLSLGILFSQQVSFLSYPTFRALNYECAGFVTAVFPAYNNGSLSEQYLYAKTDVGGIYKSTNNGDSWKLISNYRESDGSIAFSEYINAGLAINPTDKNQLIVAWGSWNSSDAITVGYQTLWRTTTGGEGDNPWGKCYIPSPGLLLDGDFLQTKVGGECIIYDPRSGNNNRVFIGGIDPSGGRPKLFMSTDYGENFIALENTIFNADVADTIYCIAMHKNRTEIYVGTAKGIYRSPGFQSNGYPQQFEKLSIPSNIGGMNVRRILIKDLSTHEKIFFAFGTSFNYGLPYPPITRAGGLASYEYDQNTPTWSDLTGNFEGSEHNYDDNNYFSLLTWADAYEQVLIAGRVNKPTKKSTNDGGNWNGEYSQWGSEIIRFIYDHDSYTFPNHQFSQYYYDEKNTFMFGGLNFLIRNPYVSNNYTWYVSGGAGLRISDNVAPTGGDVFTGKEWHYSTFGQSMPVIHDITFEKSSPSTMVYMPMADWTMAWTDDPQPCMSPGYCYMPLSYDNSITRFFNSGNNAYENTWSSNITRTLLSSQNQTNEYVTYNIGADTYTPDDNYKTATMYKRRVVNGQLDPVQRIQTTPFLTTTSNRAILDGLIFDYNESSNTFNDFMVILVGTQEWVSPQPSSDIGVYWTSNQGSTFTPSNFTTEGMQRFNISKIPSLYAQSSYAVLFTSQFNLAKGPWDPPNYQWLFLYLEDGGLFKSNDGGKTWNTADNPNCDYNPGCLKYIGNDKLLIAIEGAGLFYGAINTSTGGVSWSSPGAYGFSDASQVDAKDDNWAVFGKRNGDLFPKLYKTSEPDLDHWKLITDRIRGVRSLRIHPYTNDLWIATTGLGVVVYNGLFENQPYIIKNNITFNSNTYFEKDIEIDSNGVLNLSGNIYLKMAPGKKIYVKENGKLIANNVTFNSTDSTQKWEGIYFENSSDSCIVQNCIFNNTTLPIKIQNHESSANNKKIIKNNVFNCQANQDYCVYAENVFNIIVQGNQFNMLEGSTNTVGLEIFNSCNPDNSSRNSSSALDIVGNTFTSGCASLVLNSYASELTSFYVCGNTFNGNYTHYNIIARMMTGTIKNNNFNGTGTNNPIYLHQSTPDIFGNIITGVGTTMILNGHSYPNLSPSRSSNTYYWYGGQNSLTSTSAGNINIIDAGLPLLNFGNNQFNKVSDNAFFHLTGQLDSTVTSFSAIKNSWCNSQNSNPSNYLYTSGNASVSTDFNPNYNCNNLPTIQYSSLQVTNKGFGIYDTLLISTDNSTPVAMTDENLHTIASNYMQNGQFFDAISTYKNLIDNYQSSNYLTSSAYELYDSYHSLDTSSNQTYKDNLYSDCKTYLNAKIQSGNYSYEFNDIAYYLVIMCETNMQNYNDALRDYEFIAMFHPDAEMRLLASWDHNEVEELMGSSGAEKEETMNQFRDRILTKLEIVIKKDSTTSIMNRLYKERNNDIEKYYLDKGEDIFNKNNSSKSSTDLNSNNNTSIKKTTKENPSQSKTKGDVNNKNVLKNPVTNSTKDGTVNKFILSKEKRDNIISKAESNLRTLKNMDKMKKMKMHKEDILLIAGLSLSNKKVNENTTIPLSYNLSQNYPNPFNPVTKINYELPKDGKVKLVIYDILGREMKVLVNEIKQKGRYTVEFNGTQIASGIYFYRIQIDGGSGFSAVKKMALIK